MAETVALMGPINGNGRDPDPCEACQAPAEVALLQRRASEHDRLIVELQNDARQVRDLFAGLNAFVGHEIGALQTRLAEELGDVPTTLRQIRDLLSKPKRAPQQRAPKRRPAAHGRGRR